MESCYNLANLEANCNATKKVGGVTARVWIGAKNLFLNDGNNPHYFEYGNSYTLTDNVWSLLIDEVGTPIAGTELAYFEGVRFKNSGNFEVTPGENVNTFTQNLNLVLFHYSQAQIKKLEQLLITNNLIAFVLTEAGQIKCYGIDKLLNDTIRNTEGLKPIAGTGADIVELQGEVGVQIQLQATLLNMPIVVDGYYFKNWIDQYITGAENIVNLLNTMSANNA
jgi:hypothetical protein